MNTRTRSQCLTRAGLIGALLFCALPGLCGQGAAPRTVPAGSPAAVEARPTLLGRWKSTTDPLYELEITPTLYTEKYQGKPAAVSMYQVTTKCECAEEKQLVYGAPTVLTTRNRQDKDCDCYLIEKLTPTSLRLANYGQGGFHPFKRLN